VEFPSLKIKYISNLGIRNKIRQNLFLNFIANYDKIKFMNQIDFTKLKPAAYSRKSSESEDKQMLSISSQHEENKKSADYYNLPPFVEIFEESKSAKTEFMRPEFTRMFSLIDSGLIDCIVCWKPDRLARNMTEGGRIIDALSSGKLKAIITHDKVFYPWDNVLILAIEFGMGKQFVKDLSVNVKRGQHKKASMGVPHGVASLGFLNDKSEEKGNRKWTVDEIRLKLIKILLDKFLTGTYSAGKLHRYAVETLKLTTVKRKRIGGNLITLSRIYEILKDPIYAGFFFYDGQRYELDSNLPRLITEAQHNKIKMILSKANIPKTQNHNTTYSGFINSPDGNFVGQDVKFQVICDCKHKFAYRNKANCPKCEISIEQMKNPKYLSYIWHYNVKNKKARMPYKSINEQKIDEEIINKVVSNLQFSDDVILWSKKYIHEMKNKEVSEKITISQRKEERMIEFREKKAKLRGMFRDGKFNEGEYKEDLELLNIQYKDTQEDSKEVDWYSRLMEITDITGRIEKIFKGDDVEAKRKMLSALGSNLIWNDKELLIYNDKAIEKLIEGVKRAKQLDSKFEPKNYVVDKGLKEKADEFSPAFSTIDVYPI